ncbi:MAG: MoaD/ThiS family protein [Methanotrichaceae archaeon]|nr:MoaD/ThiS family protein [Methanotrichaceae archaeon]
MNIASEEVRGRTYDALLRELDFNPETVIVLNDGEPVPFDDIIQEGEITIIRAVSSG